jgi:hypothetical protein
VWLYVLRDLLVVALIQQAVLVFSSNSIAMKSLRFQKLFLCSDLEKSARVATFNQSKTVIQGENDTGKSCLIKSIYAALMEVQQEIETIDAQIIQERTKLDSFTVEIERINGLLDAQRGEIKLRDLIEGESERLIDVALREENRGLDAAVGEQDARADAASQTMKSYENPKYQRPIKNKYFAHMKGFISDLKVPNLPEKTYKRIDCTITETGSDLPRALLAYYLAFIHTMKMTNSSSLCPLVIDTPVQQDQDPANAALMIEKCLNGAPKDTQIILGTVGLHGVPYNGYSRSWESPIRVTRDSNTGGFVRQEHPPPQALQFPIFCNNSLLPFFRILAISTPCPRRGGS